MNRIPSVAVLVCSSDGRKDILERVLPALFNYWPDCPYPVYVGLNTQQDLGPRVTTLVAPPSEWRTECRDQVAQLRETHLIVILDDFLIQETVDQARLTNLVSEALKLDLPYLRLLPLGRSMLERFSNLFRSGPAVDIRVIKEGRPFYSGLQITVWNKAHFVALLETRGSIWDFEHHSRPDALHYVIAGSAPITYSHLVEKGRWLPYAESLLKQAGLPTDLGDRPKWPRWINLRLLLDRLRFYVVGYANH